MEHNPPTFKRICLFFLLLSSVVWAPGCNDKAGPAPALNCNFTYKGKSYSTGNIVVTPTLITATIDEGTVLTMTIYSFGSTTASFLYDSGSGVITPTDTGISFHFDLSFFGQSGDPVHRLEGTAKLK